MNVLVVGAGAMGRWFAEAIPGDVAFADVEQGVAAEAARAVGGRAVALDADESFDVVCLAVPIPAISEAIAEHAPNADRAMLDVSGVMADPVEAMAEHAPNVERVSLHPLFGADTAPGNVAVVADESGPVTRELLDAIEARGNTLVETTAAEHDDAMTTVQAGTHAAVLAFALASNPVPEGLRTPVYEELAALADHVTDGEPRVYADIQATFDGATGVAEAAKRLADADPADFERLYREAAESEEDE
ncbi:prephenate dehydrogenase/arogenate dehydrogenase family protein (plasmid) [Haladaptatus sp. SPP-AMP-3]|uniref:prephenate dehydrogenase/arogenate dehydrogenase family protein n=1 Tax=Haladaptatus sp. SPP-AMP-3 TaxID=3121295 RepID=UPI003C2B7612